MVDYVPRRLAIPVGDRSGDRSSRHRRTWSSHRRRRAYIVRQFGIDVERPLLLQVSRFDPWKDPLGVGRRVPRGQGETPEVQLALIGSSPDDPKGWEFLERLLAYVAATPTSTSSRTSTTWARGDQRVPEPRRRGHAEVHARGFGLTSPRGCGRAAPIGGAVGGIALQIEDGVTGYLVTRR